MGVAEKLPPDLFSKLTSSLDGPLSSRQVRCILSFPGGVSNWFLFLLHTLHIVPTPLGFAFYASPRGARKDAPYMVMGSFPYGEFRVASLFWHPAAFEKIALPSLTTIIPQTLSALPPVDHLKNMLDAHRWYYLFYWDTPVCQYAEIFGSYEPDPPFYAPLHFYANIRCKRKTERNKISAFAAKHGFIFHDSGANIKLTNLIAVERPSFAHLPYANQWQLTKQIYDNLPV